MQNRSRLLIHTTGVLHEQNQLQRPSSDDIMPLESHRHRASRSMPCKANPPPDPTAASLRTPAHLIIVHDAKAIQAKHMPLGAHFNAARPTNLAPSAATTAAAGRYVVRLAHAHANITRPPPAAPAVLVAVQVALHARGLEAHVAALHEGASILAPRRRWCAHARPRPRVRVARRPVVVRRGGARFAERAPVPLVGEGGGYEAADFEERLADRAGQLGGAEFVVGERVENGVHGHAGRR
jgi:hypothetical protein